MINPKRWLCVFFIYSWNIASMLFSVFVVKEADSSKLIITLLRYRRKFHGSKPWSVTREKCITQCGEIWKLCEKPGHICLTRASLEFCWKALHEKLEFIAKNRGGRKIYDLLNEKRRSFKIDAESVRKSAACIMSLIWRVLLKYLICAGGAAAVISSWLHHVPFSKYNSDCMNIYHTIRYHTICILDPQSSCCLHAIIVIIFVIIWKENDCSRERARETPPGPDCWRPVHFNKPRYAWCGAFAYAENHTGKM